MSRLFENFGDDADETESPLASALGDEAATLAPVDVFSDDVFSAPVAATGESGARPLTERGSKSLNLDEIEQEPPPKRVAGAAPPTSYEIPDFDKDTKELEAYEDAKRRYQRQQLASAEHAIQTSFAQKRDQLQREMKNGKSFEEERRTTAQYTTRQYAHAYPVHVDKRGISPPSFFESLFSFGRASRLYRAAFVAAEALDQLRQAMRKREEQLGALDEQMSRAIQLKEEALKKSFESAAGLNEFHERPEIKSVFKHTENIRKERDQYEKRLQRGEVGDEEQRDRAMAEQKLIPTDLPIAGAIIAKVARFGNLSYFQLRDLDRKESLLSYDPRLDPLRNSVFDVYSVAGTVTAKLRRNDNGTAFRVADHFKACWRSQDKAEDLYGRHRAALREDRGLAPMEARNASEAEIIARLAALAAMVDAGQSGKLNETAPHGAPAPQ